MPGNGLGWLSGWAFVTLPPAELAITASLLLFLAFGPALLIIYGG